MTLPSEKFLDEISGKWLTKSQIQRRRRQEAAWDSMFEKLREFKKANGHCNVLRSDPDRELSSWVHTQRNRRAGDALLPYQRKLLEDLGFVFFLGKGFHHVRQEASDQFKARYSELQAFKEAHGHCRIPKVYKANQHLAWWYHQLRPRRRKQLLSQEEIDRLDEIGFEWETEKSLKAEQLRAEREAFETNRREREAIRIRELQVQQLAAAQKSSLARAVLPLKRRLPTSVSVRSPAKSKMRSKRSLPMRSRRRSVSGSPTDTEVEGDGDVNEPEGEDEEAADHDENGSVGDEEEEDGSVATAEVVARRCSRVDYDSDDGDDKVVVASIVWDDAPPPVKDQG